MVVNKYELEDIKESLKLLAEKLKSDDYRRKIRGSLNEESDEEKQEIFDACYRVAEVLDLNSKALRDLAKKLKTTAKIKEKLEDEYATRAEARRITNLPESTFDRKAKEFKKIINGKPKYRVGDLHKIARLIIESSDTVICVNTHYFFERSINAYIKFVGGQHYPIVKETDNIFWLYNEKHNISIQMHKKYTVNFKRKEDLDF